MAISTVVIALVLGIVGTSVAAYLAVRASRQSDIESSRAIDAEKRALNEATRLREQMYAATMNWAMMAWDDNNLVRVRELLRQYLPENDLRGFEWRYLWHLSQHGAESPEFPRRGQPGRVRWMNISSRRHLVAIGYANGSVRVWNLRDESLVQSLRQPRSDFADGKHSRWQRPYVQFSPDGKTLAFPASNNRDLVLFDFDQQTSVPSGLSFRV